MRIVTHTGKNQVFIKYRYKPRRMKIVIRNNNWNCEEYCPICGKFHQDSLLPYWIFPDEPDTSLCIECCERYSPELLKEVIIMNNKYENYSFDKTESETESKESV